MKQHRTCSNCGTELVNGEEFCPNCGSAVQENATIVAENQITTKVRKRVRKKRVKKKPSKEVRWKKYKKHIIAANIFIILGMLLAWLLIRNLDYVGGLSFLFLLFVISALLFCALMFSFIAIQNRTKPLDIILGLLGVISSISVFIGMFWMIFIRTP